MAENLNNFIVNSNYPNQKLIFVYEGEYSPSDPYWDTNYLAPNVGTHIKIPLDDGIVFSDVLIDGIWTTDNWKTSYPLNSGGKYGEYVSKGSTYLLNERMEAMHYDEHSISITASTDDGQSNYKFRVWLYLLEPSDNSSTNRKTSEQLSSSLQKDTRLAQLNVISEIKATVAQGQTYVYRHNLGFKPYIKYWAASYYYGLPEDLPIWEDYFFEFSDLWEALPDSQRTK